MGEAETRVTTRADAKSALKGDAADAPVARDWKAPVRRVWPFVAMALAALLWWPAAFSGTGDWMNLPISARTGSFLFLGSLVSAAVVAALVSAPWPRFGLAFGLLVVAWLVTGASGGFLPGELPVLAGLAGVGMLLGLLVGSRAQGGPVAFATFLAMVAGLSPATWTRGPLLAVAVALPFWVATQDRVAPTILAVVRVLFTWLATVLISVGLHSAWSQLPPGALGADLLDAARTVGQGFVDTLRARWAEIIEASARAYTGWIWLAVVLAVAFVMARLALTRRRANAS